MEYPATTAVSALIILGYQISVSPVFIYDNRKLHFNQYTGRSEEEFGTFWESV